MEILLFEQHIPREILDGIQVVHQAVFGGDVLKEVQRIENCRDIPVIFVTGMDAPDFEIKGLELGASDYIVKPFIKDILIARINSQLRKKSAEESIVKKYKDDALAMMTKELSDTELMVAKYIADGLSNQEIAERTNYSYAYIKKVTSSILGKLDLQNRTEIRGMLLCLDFMMFHMITFWDIAIRCIQSVKTRKRNMA